MLKVAFVALLVVHGLIHLIGAAKGLGWATVEQLLHPVSKLEGAAWLAVTVLFVASAALLALRVDAWWMCAAPALVLSQFLIAHTPEARFGTIANVIILVPVALAVFDLRPTSLRAKYERKVSSVAPARDAPLVTRDDLRALPPIVQRYLEGAGVVGKPRVHAMRVRWRGEIRNGADAAWMPFTATQVNTFDGERARYFFITSSMYGVPFDGLHAYEAGHATMDVRVAGVVPVVTAAGAEMDVSETVTMFNDLCAFAPAALIDAPVVWAPIDDLRVRGTFTNAGHTVSAELVFNARGELVDFVSQDRLQTADGKTYRRFPWSTPLGAYAEIGGVRLASHGDAKWLQPEGELVYGRFDVVDLAYNP